MSDDFDTPAGKNLVRAYLSTNISLYIMKVGASSDKILVAKVLQTEYLND